jgi:hypothetical protein
LDLAYNFLKTKPGEGKLFYVTDSGAQTSG